MPYSLDPNANVGFMIHDVSRLMRGWFDARAQDMGLTRAQWRVLVHLAGREDRNRFGDYTLAVRVNGRVGYIDTRRLTRILREKGTEYAWSGVRLSTKTQPAARASSPSVR